MMDTPDTLQSQSPSVYVAAIDPGTTNIAWWVGECNLKEAKVRTMEMVRGCEDTSSATASAPAAMAKANTSSSKTCKPKSKEPVYAISARAAMLAADACISNGVKLAVVETAPQWNTPARISAATVYGVLRGRGVPAVFSGPNTKSKAMQYFADRMGVKLQQVPEELSRKVKGEAEKIRRINKYNSKIVVEALVERSTDVKGKEALERCKPKTDDVSDAMLLACGGLIRTTEEQEKSSAKLERLNKRIEKKRLSEEKKAQKQPPAKKKARTIPSASSVKSKMEPADDSDTSSCFSYSSSSSSSSS